MNCCTNVAACSDSIIGNTYCRWMNGVGEFQSTTPAPLHAVHGPVVTKEIRVDSATCNLDVPAVTTNTKDSTC